MHENRCENAAKMSKVGAYHANVFSKNRWAAKEDANLPQSVNRNRQHARAVSRSNLFTGMLRSNLSEKFLKIRPARTITWQIHEVLFAIQTMANAIARLPSVLRHNRLEGCHHISLTLLNLRLHANSKQESIQIIFAKRRGSQKCANVDGRMAFN